MQHTNTIVIGGGQAGLATSRCLFDAGRDHVVLERGRVAESWRSERWDSLRMLTPNWMVRLPVWIYDGAEPDGFMASAGFVTELERYATSFDAPVHEHTTVEGVAWDGEGYVVATDQGSWRAPKVVVATGHCMHPSVPSFAPAVASSIHQITAQHYRAPDQLPPGGVLIVGASATGLQLAEELARSGRDVVLAVGGHTRVPRRYRGLDIYWWLDQAGLLDDRIDTHPDPERARRTPSLSLIGSPEGRDLDLATVQAAGVALAGRLEAIAGSRATFASTLTGSVVDAQTRMHRTLDRIDRYIATSGLSSEVDADDRPGPIAIGPAPSQLDLKSRNVTSVLWATGYTRRYPWLPGSALTPDGQVRHRNGIGALPGLYVVGLRFQRHRNSSFIGGVGRDARFVVDHLTGHPVAGREVAA